MTKIKRYIVSIAFVLFGNLMAFCQIYNTKVEAKINIKENSEFIEISGEAHNKTALNQNLRYVLSVIKNDSSNSNTSKNNQSGRLLLEPREKKNLSSTTINSNEKDRIIILLLIYNTENILLGKDRIVINDHNDNTASNNKDLPEDQNVKNDGIVLKGIVTEDTKTKFGRDFYKRFYSLYQLYNINGEEPVIIRELLAMANSTKIQVITDNMIVFEFILKPKNEYLVTMAEASIKKIIIKFEDIKQGRNLVRYY